MFIFLDDLACNLAEQYVPTKNVIKHCDSVNEYFDRSFVEAGILEF